MKITGSIAIQDETNRLEDDRLQCMRLGFVGAPLSFVLWFSVMLIGATDFLAIGASAISAVTAGHSLWLLFSRPRYFWNFLLLSSLVLSFSQNAALAFAISFGDSNRVSRLEFALSNVDCNVAEYINALCYCLAFGSVLFAIGTSKISIETMCRLSKSFRQFTNGNINRIIIVSAALIALQIALLVSGKWAFRGFVSETYEERTVAWYGDFLDYLPLFNLMLLFPFLSQWRILLREVKILHLLVLASLGAITGFSYLTRGRSMMVFAAATSVFLMIEAKQKVLTIRSALIYAAVSGPILLQLLVFNNFIRSSNNTSEDWQNKDVRELLTSAIEKFGDHRSEEIDNSIDNLRTRGLLLTGLAKMISCESPNLPLMGEDIWNSFIVSVPSFIVGDKRNYPVQERLVFMRTGVLFPDMADSVYLSSYNDFSFVGLFIVPFVLASMFWSIGYLSSRCSPLIAMFAISPWTSFFITGINESSMGSPIRSFLFSLLFFGVGLLVSGFLGDDNIGSASV